MKKKTNEETRKQYWLNHLANIDKKWVDGDQEDKSNATADLVNHNLHVAIELKTKGAKTISLQDFPAIEYFLI